MFRASERPSISRRARGRSPERPQEPYRGEREDMPVSHRSRQPTSLGRVEERCAARNVVLNAAWKAHLERFVRGESMASRVHSVAYSNRPKTQKPRRTCWSQTY
jgi:hypothetical protein